MGSRDVYFEDVEIGDEIGPLHRVVTDAQVEDFVRVWAAQRDPSRFTDSDVARREGLAGPMVPGAMSVAMLGQLVTGWSKTVTLRKIDAIFRQIVLHNVELRLAAVVTDKAVVEGNHQVECDVTIENAEGGILVMGRATASLPSRGAPAEAANP